MPGERDLAGLGVGDAGERHPARPRPGRAPGGDLDALGPQDRRHRHLRPPRPASAAGGPGSARSPRPAGLASDAGSVAGSALASGPRGAAPRQQHHHLVRGRRRARRGLGLQRQRLRRLRRLGAEDRDEVAARVRLDLGERRVVGEDRHGRARLRRPATTADPSGSTRTRSKPGALARRCGSGAAAAGASSVGWLARGLPLRGRRGGLGRRPPRAPRRAPARRGAGALAARAR